MFALLLASFVDLPNINARGSDEEEFLGKMAEAIVSAARPSVRTASVELKDWKKSILKGNRIDYHIVARFKGITKKDHTATIVMRIDTTNKDDWEILRIEYKDTSRNFLGFNRKNLDKLIDKLNGK